MKTPLYAILVTGTVLMLGCIILFAKSPVKKIPPYKERIGEIAISGEWLNTKTAIEGLMAAIEKNPYDKKSMLSLSQAYIQEGRVTGNHAYYDRSALELIDAVLKTEPNNYDALCCKSTVLLSQHHFSEGLDVARNAASVNPYSAFAYGLLCDANVELGRYTEAIKMADKMVSIRPDMRSYARVSYLREIHGDLDGAISAMKLAVSAGYPGLEQTEWARCTLAHLYENSGDLMNAESEYKIALAERPDYAFAIAGLGKIEKDKGNIRNAISYFEKANTMITEYSFSDELTDLYRMNGEAEKAMNNAEQVIQMLGPNKVDESEEGHGHYADKELAYAYLKKNDTENALRHALIEFNRRPGNIEVCETLAWVRYKRNEMQKANSLIDLALRTGNQNPILLYRAGLIKIKSGEIQKGKTLMQTALLKNPFLEKVSKEIAYKI